MISKIIVEIRHNKTNNQCTDGETDCPQMDYKFNQCWCNLFGGSVEDGPLEACLKKRQETRELIDALEQMRFKETVHYAKKCIANAKSRVLDDLASRPYAKEEATAICEGCGADPGDDSKCANCDDTFHLFKKKEKK